jgi:hypothetical protein
VVDLGDLEYLKQITLATTGGMLLFYMTGVFLAISYYNIILQTRRPWFSKSILLVFTSLLFWMMYNFSRRLHPKLFYLTGVDGSYQRSGNFLSISFITVSYLYLALVFIRKDDKPKRISDVFWLMIYSLSALLALTGSQLFGSNSATVVILGVCLITLVIILVVSRQNLWFRYQKNKLILPCSWQLVKRLALKSLLVMFSFSILLLLLLHFTSFDITSIRALGFGSGSNTSLAARFEILKDTGIRQVSYSPLVGNINVAYLVTGNAGRTLHSFIPYVLANLGLIGLFLVLAIFFGAFRQLFREAKVLATKSQLSYQKNILAIYSIFILLYLFLFANIATGVSWSVLWFTLGFVSSPVRFR